MSSKSPVDVFDTTTFVEDVERYRKRHGYSMNEFADIADIARSTYKKIVCGYFTPGLRVTCILADACDISLDKYRKVSV